MLKLLSRFLRVIIMCVCFRLRLQRPLHDCRGHPDHEVRKERGDRDERVAVGGEMN